MQLPRERAHVLVEQPLDEGVHVLVRGAHGGAVRQTLGDPIETLE